MTEKSASSKAKSVNWDLGGQYRTVEVIGKGSYGQVVKAIDQRSNAFVAIKRMEVAFDEAINARRAYRELRILRHLNHPYIVPLLDVYAPQLETGLTRSLRLKKVSNDESKEGDDVKEDLCVPIPRNLGHIYLVFEHMDTDLSKIIKSNQFLSDEHVQFILYQVLEGVQYIHNMNIIHRDLKPANILVSCADCSIKIADFGLARVAGSHYFNREGSTSSDSSEAPSRRYSHSFSSDSLESPRSKDAPAPPAMRRSLTRHVVTRWYRGPEVILSQPYSCAVDYWSIGCIFAELISMMQENQTDHKKRKPLFPGDSCGDLSIEDESIANFQEQDDEGYKHAAPSFDCGDLGDHSLEGEELDFSRLSIDSTREDIQRDSRWANLAQEEMRKYQNQKSQLNLIFDLIGTPEPSDLVFLDDRIRAMLLAIDKKPPKNFKALFPSATAACLDLLSGLLQFHPGKRILPTVAMEHSYFDIIKAQGYVSSASSASNRSTDRERDSHSSSSPKSGSTDSGETSTGSRSRSGSNLSSSVGDPLDSGREKVRESPLHIRRNFVMEVMHYVRKRKSESP